MSPGNPIVHNLHIGGIFSAHEGYYIEHNNGNTTCSNFSLTNLMKAQAMIYAVYKANQEIIRAPYALKYDLIDDCNNIDEAVHAAMLFMMGETTRTRRKWIASFKQGIGLLKRRK